MATALLTAVYSTLSGDPTLTGLATGGVHHAMAPPLTVPPFAIFYPVPGPGPDYTFGAVEAYDEFLIVFKGVAADKEDGSAAGVDLAESIRARGKVLLSNAALSVAGYTLLSILCDRALPAMTEEVGGKIRYHRGDYYRVLLQKN